MHPQVAALLPAFRAAAAAGPMDIDHEVYAEAGLSVDTPVVLGSGSTTSRIGVFGRDPGRFEIIHREPFIGKGGQLVRSGLHQRLFGAPCESIEASVKAGQHVFWGNTVPYKPKGNKAWSVAVKRRFVPVVRTLLTDVWQGDQLITLGNVAFDWFRLAEPSLRDPLKAFWARPDRYTASLTVDLGGKSITLYPLPHPSPLNATWYPRFPGLLQQRLAALGWPDDTEG